jgi:hypothetical protein
MKAVFLILCIGAIVYTVSAGTVSLVADITPPDPNDEITIWVHTDEPLLFMELGVYVNGDATITSAMSEADCNDFGWENGWGFEPIIDDPNGWVSIGGVCWAADANDSVGYFKFRYHSGQVAVYIDQDNSIAGNWGNNFTFSDEVFLFGEMALPALNEPNEPIPVLIQCPLDLGGLARGESENFDGWSEELSRGMDELDSEPNIIEINSDITTNQVWDANNVYYITDVNGVDVQALLVIEPGTTIIMGYECGLFVNNGGTLIAKGTPDKPIIFTPDYMYYDNPDYIGYYWQVLADDGPYYYSPIYIQDTASPATTVRYCMIEGAVGGIITDNIRLDNAIENNYLFGNAWGVYEFGPKLTDIRNNLCYYNDYAGIEVYLLPDPNKLPDTENPFTIEQNTCDSYQYCGITIHGVPDPNNAPTVYLFNNIVSSSDWYGLNLVDGYMQMVVVSTGYYNNYYDKNWDFDEYNPVCTETNPYSPYMGEKAYQHHFLADDSAFIDAGSQYIEQTKLIGTTTNFDSLPDKDIVDLGFHSMDWNYIGGEGIAGTDIDDLITLSNYWLTYTPYEPNSPGYIDPNLYIYDPNHPENWIDPNFVSYGGDWNNDGFVNLADFAILAGMWQKIQEIPEITASINVSSEDGSIEVQVQDGGSPIYQCFLLIDGVFVKELIFSEEIFQRTVYMPWLSPGSHEARIIGSGRQGFIFSAVIPFEIDNAIGPCIVPLMFEMGEPLPFLANSGVDVRVSAWVSGHEVWSQSYPSGMVRGSVPAAVTDANDIEFLMIAPAVPSAGASPVAVPVDSEDNDSGDYTALMIRPDFKINWETGLADYVYEKLVEMGYKVKKLRYYNSSFKNVKKYIDENTIKVLYYDGHGNSYIHPYTDIKRSVLELDDCKIVSDKISNYPPGQAPSWLEPLPPAIEASVRTWRELNLKDLKFAAFDACKAMRLKINGQGKLEESTSQAYTYRGDLSMVLLQRGEYIDQWVFGWAPDFVSGYGTDYQGFSIDMWKKLAEGKTLAEAISYAYGRALEEVRNGYRLQGHDDPFDFKL